MSESKNHVSGWPMGALLRFRLDADLQAKQEEKKTSRPKPALA